MSRAPNEAEQVLPHKIVFDRGDLGQTRAVEGDNFFSSKMHMGDSLLKSGVGTAHIASPNGFCKTVAFWRADSGDLFVAR